MSAYSETCVLLQVGNNGGIEGLVVDTAGRYISSTYARRISLHEAGHFLIAYLIGLLPKAYTLSTLDAVQRYAVDTNCLRFAIHAAPCHCNTMGRNVYCISPDGAHCMVYCTIVLY